MQSTWENVVDYNLSESGVHPMTLEELATAKEIRLFTKKNLGYIQSNGTPELRAEIAGLYAGAAIDNILVTSGSSEANYLLIWKTIEPGDEVLFELPIYMQMWGLARAFGARVKTFELKEELGWQPDLRELERLVTKKTKLIILTNPNNPTGAILSPEAVGTIIGLASRVGAWIIADEVYQGAELRGPRTPSFWGQYEKLFVVNGLSKAYGLPGVRMGWIAGPKKQIPELWAYHDYTTISTTALSDLLARIALRPSNRGKIRKRTQAILNRNWPALESWLRKQDGIFEFQPPQAGAICFVRYNLKINSTRLVRKLIKEKSVLIVPGDHFLMDRHLRIGFGSEIRYTLAGLKRIAETVKELRSSTSR
jgi:aspartate/methionine/tyrosine aminotransferase